MRSACCAGSAAGSPRGHLGEQRGEAHFAEEIEPVVRRRAIGAERDVDAAPRAASATGAMPLPSFMFDAGQCTTWPPCVASSVDVRRRRDARRGWR